MTSSTTTAPTGTTTTGTKIRRRITLSYTVQDAYFLELELPEGVSVEDVDAELIDHDSKYDIDCSCYAWHGVGSELACGATVTEFSEDRDNCSELDCGPIVRDDAPGSGYDLVPGSSEWPGHA